MMESTRAEMLFLLLFERSKPRRVASQSPTSSQYRSYVESGHTRVPPAPKLRRKKKRNRESLLLGETLANSRPDLEVTRPSTPSSIHARARTPLADLGSNSAPPWRPSVCHPSPYRLCHRILNSRLTSIEEYSGLSYHKLEEILGLKVHLAVCYSLTLLFRTVLSDFCFVLFCYYFVKNSVIKWRLTPCTCTIHQRRITSRLWKVGSIGHWQCRSTLTKETDLRGLQL